MLTAIQKIFFAISINYVKLQLCGKINANINIRVSIFNYELQWYENRLKSRAKLKKGVSGYLLYVPCKTKFFLPSVPNLTSDIRHSRL